MTLRFDWDWQAAPEVKAPELAVTWSRLRIDVAGVTATLVEERASAHGGAVEWLDSALRSLSESQGPHVHVEPVALPFGERARPWEVGYERASRLRASLGSEPTAMVDLEDLATVVSVAAPAPPGIAGLVDASADTTTVVLSSGASRTGQRFSGARALGRRSFDGRQGQMLLRATLRQYAERVERAFAAEFLAPAVGVAELLQQDFTDSAIEKLALHYGVSPRVIEHQVENQVAA